MPKKRLRLPGFCAGSIKTSVDVYPCQWQVLEFIKKKNMYIYRVQSSGSNGGNREWPSKSRGRCQVQGEGSLTQSPARNKAPKPDLKERESSLGPWAKGLTVMEGHRGP